MTSGRALWRVYAFLGQRSARRSAARSASGQSLLRFTMCGRRPVRVSGEAAASGRSLSAQPRALPKQGHLLPPSAHAGVALSLNNAAAGVGAEVAAFAAGDDIARGCSVADLRRRRIAERTVSRPTRRRQLDSLIAGLILLGLGATILSAPGGSTAIIQSRDQASMVVAWTKRSPLDEILKHTLTPHRAKTADID